MSEAKKNFSKDKSSHFYILDFDGISLQSKIDQITRLCKQLNELEEIPASASSIFLSNIIAIFAAIFLERLTAAYVIRPLTDFENPEKVTIPVYGTCLVGYLFLMSHLNYQYDLAIDTTYKAIEINLRELTDAVKDDDKIRKSFISLLNKITENRLNPALINNTFKDLMQPFTTIKNTKRLQKLAKECLEMMGSKKRVQFNFKYETYVPPKNLHDNKTISENRVNESNASNVISFTSSPSQMETAFVQDFHYQNKFKKFANKNKIKQKIKSRNKNVTPPPVNKSSDKLKTASVSEKKSPPVTSNNNRPPMSPRVLYQNRSPNEAKDFLFNTIALKRKKIIENSSLLQDNDIKQITQCKPSHESTLITAFILMKMLETSLQPKCKVFIVGGLPRDLLSGAEKSNDIDLVCNFDADQLNKEFEKLAKQDKNFSYNKLKCQNVAVFQFSYKGIKFDIQADPRVKLRANGEVDHKSLLHNSELRDATFNGIFIDSNGEFPITTPEIEKLIKSSIDPRHLIQKGSNGIIVEASPGHLTGKDIENYISNFKTKYKKLWDDSSLRADLEHTVKNYIDDPNRLLRVLKFLIGGKITWHQVAPAIKNVFSYPGLMQDIFLASIKLKKENILSAALGFQGVLKALFMQGLAPKSTATEKSAQSKSPPDKKADSVIATVSVKEVIKTDASTASIKLAECWKQANYRHLLLLALQAGATPAFAEKIANAADWLFTDSDSYQASNEQKEKSAIQFSSDSMKDFLFARFVKLNFIALLDSFQEKINLNVVPLYPTLADKMLPLAIAIWCQQNPIILPQRENFHQQIMKIINQFPVLQQVQTKSLPGILDDAYNSISEHFKLTTPETEVEADKNIASNFLSSSSLTVSSSTSWPTHSLALPSQHSNSSSHWRKKEKSKEPEKQEIQNFHPTTKQKTDKDTTLVYPTS